MLERPSNARTATRITPAALGIWPETDAFLTARQAMIAARDKAISRCINEWFTRAWASAIKAHLQVLPHIHDLTPWIKPEPALFVDGGGWMWNPTVRAKWSAEEPCAVTFEPNGVLPDGRLHHGNSRWGTVSARAEMLSPAVVGRLSLRWSHDRTSVYVSPTIAPPSR